MEHQEYLDLQTRLRQGDMEALSELYEAYVDELFKFGAKLTIHHHLVEDSIHDLFLDLYKYRKRLSTVQNMKFYLLKSLKRKLFKKIKAERKKNYPEENFFEFHEESVESEIISVERTYEKQLGLQKALAALNPGQAQLINMRFTENKNYREIAIAQGVHVESVRTSMYRILKKLRNFL